MVENFIKVIKLEFFSNIYFYILCFKYLKSFMKFYRIRWFVKKYYKLKENII